MKITSVQLLTIIQVFSLLVQQAFSKCAFTVDNSGTPLAVTGNDENPSVHKYTSPFICADLFPGENCCNDYQNNQMGSNFLQIDATFGSAGGGCDFCGSNLKRFWCTYTCHPDQASFTTIMPNKIVVPNPLDEGATTLSVMDVRIVVGSETVCEVWSSCNLTPYATQVSAMKTPAGFLNFQGQNAVTQAAQSISVSYTSDPTVGALTMTDISPCNLPQPPVNENLSKKQPWHPDSYGFNISSACSCNNCAAACTAEAFVALPVMEGFSWLTVGIVYGCIIVLSLGCFFFRRFKVLQKRRAQREQEENEIFREQNQPNNESFQRLAENESE